MRKPVLLAAIAAGTAALLLAVAGCSGDSSPLPAALANPTAAATTAGPAAAPDTSCNPRASLRPTGSLPAAGGAMPSGSKMAEIKKRGRLILGTSQDTLLFSSRNPFSGQIEGFDVDMARLVAQAIFGDPDKIQIKVIGYDKRVSSVLDGSVDIVADTMTANCSRWKDVNFSAIYYDAGQKVLVSKDSTAKSINDLGGKKICAAAGSTSLDTIKAQASKPIAVSMPAFGDCLVAFQQNQVDAISTDDTILAGMVAQDPYAKVIGDRITDEPYGMAMTPKSPEFTRFVNAVLAKAEADGTWAATYKKWLGGTAPTPPKAEYK